MRLWSHYHIPHSTDDALRLLAQYEGRAQIIAGGTDLLIDLQVGNHPPIEALIDITKIADLLTIQADGDWLTLGAGVTHSGIVAHPVIRNRATCLVESCGVVGGPQVRNVATIGGNVAHALPAADGTLSLVALNAEAEVASVEGRKWYAITDLFTGPGKSIVDPTRHVLTRFRFRLSSDGEASAFKRIMRPQGVALPVLGCAAWVKLDDRHERFAEIHLSIGPVGPTPTRTRSIEAVLVGQVASGDIIAKAADIARTELHPRTSKYRATAEYRVEMIELLVHQSLTMALKRARTGEVVPVIES